MTCVAIVMDSDYSNVFRCVKEKHKHKNGERETTATVVDKPVHSIANKSEERE